MNNLRYLFALSLVAGLAACGDDDTTTADTGVADTGADAGGDTTEADTTEADTTETDTTVVPDEICDDGEDNDEDGDIDCDDSDCDGTEACKEPVPEDTDALCDDGEDNDEDGDIDCDDSDCATTTPCLTADCPAPGEVRGGECVQPNEPVEGAEGTYSYLNSLAIPTSGTDAECCFDFNNDGVVDNALSGVLDLVGTMADDIDVTALVEEALEADDIALVLSWGKGENEEGFHIYLATNDVDGNGEPDQAFADRVDGAGIFQLMTDAVDEYGSLVQFNVATRDGDVVTAGPSQFRLSLPIAAGGIELDLDLTIEQATIEGATVVTDTGIASVDETFDIDGEDVEFGGMKLGGVVPLDQLGALLEDLASDCTCAGFDPSLPVINYGDDGETYVLECAQTPAAGCTADDGLVCENLSTACGFLSIIVGVLSDIDMNDNGVGDAFSVGIRFGATGATLADPAFVPGE